MSKQDYLKILNKSNKPFIIYKSNKGFDLYTDFSKKIILTNQNIYNFINRITRNKYKKRATDLYIGFFGYDILNYLIGVKIPKQKGLKFPKGIFYKPEKKINLKEKLNYKSEDFNILNNNFKININKRSYKKIFDKFKKKIKSGKTYQIKICTKYQKKSKIVKIDFFCRLS